MKIIDEMETLKSNHNNTKTNKVGKQQGRGVGVRNYSERVRAKSFCCPFKLDFLQLMCKAS